MSFSAEFSGKKVIVTGHTGFKGAWLCLWLERLGAEVVGIALEPNTSPSLFYELGLSSRIKDIRVDIRHKDQMVDAISKENPDYLFHLAAQPIVKESFVNPIYNWETNLMGSLHVMESLRSLEKSCAAIMVTSDKCYENVEWLWGYRESDTLGGKDPYSASKGAVEIAIRSHVLPFSDEKCKIKIASVRAVIGGGDWAADRIVPDCIRAWSGPQSDTSEAKFHQTLATYS